MSKITYGEVTKNADGTFSVPITVDGDTLYDNDSGKLPDGSDFSLTVDTSAKGSKGVITTKTDPSSWVATKSNVLPDYMYNSGESPENSTTSSGAEPVKPTAPSDKEPVKPIEPTSVYDEYYNPQTKKLNINYTKLRAELGDAAKGLTNTQVLHAVYDQRHSNYTSAVDKYNSDLQAYQNAQAKYAEEQAKYAEEQAKYDAAQAKAQQEAADKARVVNYSGDFARSTDPTTGAPRYTTEVSLAGGDTFKATAGTTPSGLGYTLTPNADGKTASVTFNDNPAKYAGVKGLDFSVPTDAISSGRPAANPTNTYAPSSLTQQQQNLGQDNAASVLATMRSNNNALPKTIGNIAPKTQAAPTTTAPTIGFSNNDLSSILQGWFNPYGSNSTGNTAVDAMNAARRTSTQNPVLVNFSNLAHNTTDANTSATGKTPTPTQATTDLTTRVNTVANQALDNPDKRPVSMLDKPQATQSQPQAPTLEQRLSDAALALRSIDPKSPAYADVLAKFNALRYQQQQASGSDMSQGASFGYIGVDGNSHIGYGDIDPNRFSINSQGLIREIPQQTGIGTLAQQPPTPMGIGALAANNLTDVNKLTAVNSPLQQNPMTVKPQHPQIWSNSVNIAQSIPEAGGLGALSDALAQRKASTTPPAGFKVLTDMPQTVPSAATAQNPNNTAQLNLTSNAQALNRLGTITPNYDNTSQAVPVKWTSSPTTAGWIG